MRILDPIVPPPPALVPALDPEVTGSGAIGAQIIRDQSIRNEAVFLQKFTHQLERGVLVALGLDQHIQDFALGIDRAP